MVTAKSIPSQNTRLIAIIIIPLSTTKTKMEEIQLLRVVEIRVLALNISLFYLFFYFSNHRYNEIMSNEGIIIQVQKGTIPIIS